MSLRRPQTRAFWAAVLLGMVLSPAARAVEPQSEGRALFEIGVKAYDRGQFRTAVVAFQEAYRLTGRPGLLFSLGQALRRSYEETGEPAELQEAIRHYQRYLSTQHEGEHRGEAAAWVQQLSTLPAATAPVAVPASPRAQAQLVMAVNVSSATLSLDGRAVPTLPHAAAVSPGKHRLEAKAPGYATVERSVNVAEGAVISLNIELRRLASHLEVTGHAGSEVLVDGVRVGVLPLAELGVAPGNHWVEVRAPGRVTLRRAIALRADESRRVSLVAPATTRRVASWALIGGGAASLLAGGALGYLALQQESKARDLQDQAGERAAFDDAIAKRDGLRLGAAVGAAVGAAALAGGIVSIATEGYGPIRSVSATASGGDAWQAAFCGVRVSGAF